MLLRVVSAPASKSQQHCFWGGLLGPTLELWHQNLHLKPVQETLLNTNSWRWTWGFSGHVCLNMSLPYDGCRVDDRSAVAWMCPLKSTGGERNPQCSMLGGGASWELVRLWGRSEQMNAVILGSRAPLSPSSLPPLFTMGEKKDLTRCWLLDLGPPSLQNRESMRFCSV